MPTAWQHMADEIVVDLEHRKAANAQTSEHGYGKSFVVRADEILTAFVELESAIHACVKSS